MKEKSKSVKNIMKNQIKEINETAGINENQIKEINENHWE
jgi:hypothetical protein